MNKPTKTWMMSRWTLGSLVGLALVVVAMLAGPRGVGAQPAPAPSRLDHPSEPPREILVEAGRVYLISVPVVDRRGRDRVAGALYQLTPKQTLRLTFKSPTPIYVFPIAEMTVCVEGGPCYPCRPGDNVQCNGPVPPSSDPAFTVYGDLANLFRTMGIEAYTPEGSLQCSVSATCEGTSRNTCADDTNCGACGNVCPEQTTCKVGRCERRQ
jgi:hypothetical protein